MSEELKPGFVIRDVVRDALDNDEDVPAAVQVALARIGICRGREEPDHDDRGADDRFAHDDGYDLTDPGDALF